MSKQIIIEIIIRNQILVQESMFTDVQEDIRRLTGEIFAQ
jgi:hypothetical protein